GAVVEAAAIVRRAVLADGAVGQRQRAAEVMDAPACGRLVAVDGAAGDGYAAVVEDAAARCGRVVREAAVAHRRHGTNTLAEQTAAADGRVAEDGGRVER